MSFSPNADGWKTCFECALYSLLFFPPFSPTLFTHDLLLHMYELLYGLAQGLFRSCRLTIT